MIRIAFLVSLVSFSAFALSRTQVVDTTDLAVVNAAPDCGAREYNAFSLQASPALPNPPVLSANGLDYNLLAPSDSRRLRFDVCLDAKTGSAELRRVAILDDSRSVTLATLLDQKGVKGLAEALEGNYAELRVELELEKDRRFLVEGRRSDKGTYVTAVPTYLNQGKWQPASIALFAGQFGYGNSFVAGRCALGQDFQKSEFRLGSAQFQAEYCAYQGVGETTDYYFIGMSVTDTNSALGAETGKTFTFKSQEELKPVLTFRQNHHDACDSFFLKLPHAKYGATTMPVAGCGLPVPGAPERRGDDTERGVRYRIQYGNQPWQSGLMKECGHYLFGCHLAENAMLESAPAPAFRDELRTETDFATLSHRENGKRYVKYTLSLIDDKIYFQDTERYPFHYNFLKSELPRYRDLGSSAYDDLLYTPGKKEVSAGALYFGADLKIPEYSESGLLGFTVYFKDGVVDRDEVFRVYRKLRAATPFAGNRIAFAFERRGDYFKFKTKLWPTSCRQKVDDTCIPSLPLDRFVSGQ